MPRKDPKTLAAFRSYLGCEIPSAFFFRFQAMAEIRGVDNKILLALAIEEEIAKWERKIDKRTAQAYDALLDIKAYQNDYSVDQLKMPLKVSVNSRGKQCILPIKKPVSV